MHKRFVVSTALLSMTLVFMISFGWAHEAGWPGKRLSKVFPKATRFKARQVTLTPNQIARIEKATGSKLGVEEKTPTFYIAYGKDEKTGKQVPIGAVIFIDAVGERGNVEINVAVSPKGKLLAVSLWKHREAKTLGDKKFLAQFHPKKKLTDPFLVGKDIVAAPGAEKASQTVATAAKKGWLMFAEVFGKKKAASATSQDGKMDHHDEEGGHGHDKDSH